jgi:hypothetical protein
MNKTKVAFTVAAFFLGLATLQAQPKTAGPGQAENNPADSAKKSPKPRIRPYREVITANAISTKGMITIHVIEDKYYFEIPFTLFGRDLMVVNRLATAAADMRMTDRSTTGYAGDAIGGAVIQFERGVANKLYIRHISNTEYSADSTQPMYASVKRNTVAPIVAAFPIAAFNPDSTAVVIDMTDYLNSDNDLFNFSDQITKMIYHIGTQQNDKSYIKYVHVYPGNAEIRSVKTYAIGGSTRTGNYTLELNSSMILLPEVPMKPRYYDSRIGYFTTDFIDYDANPQGIKEQSLVDRWRMEPKPEDVERYQRGELVEPLNPIVFYIDRATPAKWVPYLIQGVNDWKAAFEHAGFKNAISARLAPTKEEDSTFSLEDARHSAIVYKPSPVPNAMGPHISDPRSGEILESHVNWYHNVMSLIHNWYMIQCGAVDPRARKMEFDDSLMGQLIRFVSSHEIGHTLGLRHNFGSSSTVPVDSIRNKKWVEANGHTPSIMDYARFNYIAQPEDNISETGLFPRIGDYDKWAIEWGYKWYGNNTTAEEEVTLLNQLTIEKLKNKRLWFGTEASPADPRSQNEDLGDDAMKAGTYGIKNLKRILPQLSEWTKTPNEGYDNLVKLYTVLNSQFDRYVVHVIKNIAGVYETPKTSEQTGPVYELVPVQRQKEAMAFLDQNVFKTPLWLYNKDIFSKTGESFTAFILERQGGVINSLIGTYRMSRMINAEATMDKPVYTINNFFSDLDHSILTEMYAAKPVDMYRRNLQKIYIDKLISFAFPPSANSIMVRGGDTPDGSEPRRNLDVLPSKYSDIMSVTKGELREQLRLFKKVLPLVQDTMSREHIQDLIDRITAADPANK